MACHQHHFTGHCASHCRSVSLSHSVSCFPLVGIPSLFIPRGSPDPPLLYLSRFATSLWCKVFSMFECQKISPKNPQSWKSSSKSRSSSLHWSRASMMSVRYQDIKSPVNESRRAGEIFATRALNWCESMTFTISIFNSSFFILWDDEPLMSRWWARLCLILELPYHRTAFRLSSLCGGWWIYGGTWRKLSRCPLSSTGFHLCVVSNPWNFLLKVTACVIFPRWIPKAAAITSEALVAC